MVYFERGDTKMANKGDLISEITKKTDLNKKQASLVLDALLDTIKDTLADGKKVQLIGFGTFEVRHRAARTGRNPQTGKAIKIPATDIPAFKPGKSLKDAVKK